MLIQLSRSDWRKIIRNPALKNRLELLMHTYKSLKTAMKTEEDVRAVIEQEDRDWKEAARLAKQKLVFKKVAIG